MKSLELLYLLYIVFIYMLLCHSNCKCRGNFQPGRLKVSSLQERILKLMHISPALLPQAAIYARMQLCGIQCPALLH